MQKLKIGFIGIGVMGKSMADNLLKAGYEVMVYTRTKQKAESLLAKGAKWFDSAKALAQNVDVIISMVGYPQDVAEIYLGENGVIKNFLVRANMKQCIAMRLKIMCYTNTCVTHDGCSATRFKIMSHRCISCT